VDPSGKFAYAATFGSANGSAYTIDATTGVLTQVELATGRARTRLLGEAAEAASLAIAGGQRDAVTLALRGRAREALQAGTGAADLEEARRMDPQLVLLRPLGR